MGWLFKTDPEKDRKHDVRKLHRLKKERNTLAAQNDALINLVQCQGCALHQQRIDLVRLPGEIAALDTDIASLEKRVHKESTLDRLRLIRNMWTTYAASRGDGCSIVPEPCRRPDREGT